MPMTFDTYNRCSYNCWYCFAFYQKSHCVHGYKEGIVRSVNPDHIKRLFSFDDSVSLALKQFFPYIRSRYVMQWGALSDPFDQYEKRYGVSLDLLRFFDGIDYPLSFSTKGTWWTKDPRYMSLFERHTHNWHVKVSIITSDEKKARQMERGVPTPKERIEAIRRLSEIGISTTLRLRPYIIGLSGDWKELIHDAAEAGAKSVTTEFFCLDMRADDDLKERYRRMSEIVGYDIYDYYKKFSTHNGYKRLSEGIKRPIITAMRDYAHSLGLRFNVSDAFCRDLNDSVNCCGVPPDWKTVETHFGGAILDAKRSGKLISFDDYSDEIQKLFGGFLYRRACEFNSCSCRVRAQYKTATMADYIKYHWNHPSSQKSLAKMYGSIMRPVGISPSKNVIWKYTGPK